MERMWECNQVEFSQQIRTRYASLICKPCILFSVSRTLRGQHIWLDVSALDTHAQILTYLRLVVMSSGHALCHPFCLMDAQKQP